MKVGKKENKTAKCSWFGYTVLYSIVLLCKGVQKLHSFNCKEEKTW